MEEPRPNSAVKKFINTFIKYFTATVVFIFIIPTVFMYLMFFKTWHIFTEKRIETLEEVFQTDFPDGTDFIKYKRINGMDGGVDWLYINGIFDPEEFCRSCVNIPIEFMADIKKAKVIECADYPEDTAAYYANYIERLSSEKIRWDSEERYTDFFCAFQSEGHYEMSLYFSKNNNGGYDVKFEIK